jgi:hypothetical protein
VALLSALAWPSALLAQPAAPNADGNAAVTGDGMAPGTPPPLALDAPGPPAPKPAADASASNNGSGAPEDAGSAADDESVVVIRSDRQRPRELGLNPAAPRAPGGIGAGNSSDKAGVALEPGWAFQFHGYLSAPLAVGIAGVEHPAPGQASLALHTPPQSVDTWGSFNYTNVVPGPWVQLNFSYGNRNVTGTVVIAAYGIGSASAWYNPAAQLGINKAFLTWDVPGNSRMRALLRVGGFGNTYGYQGQYDNGRYETPLIAATNGIGETFTIEYHTPTLAFQLEHGFLGSQDIAPEAIRMNSYTGSSPISSHGIAEGSSLCAQNPPRTTEEARVADKNASLTGPAYGWPDCNVGTSFVHHLHAGLGIGESLHLGVHWLHAFSFDDRTPDLPPVQNDPDPSLPARNQPAGSIDVLGAEARLKSERFGHLFVGANYTKLVDASTVGTVISVLNAGGGAGLSRWYFGPQSHGNGSLVAAGAQYELNVTRAITAPESFNAEAPAVTATLFGMAVRANSPDATFDGRLSYKLGAELGVGLLEWLSLQGRFDHVVPQSQHSRDNREVATLRAIFKSEWLARERIWIQYSHWFLGGAVVDPYTAAPPTDKDMLALVATLWW